MELSARPYLKLGVAATMAGAIAFSPIVITDHQRLAVPAVPPVTVSQTHLAASITPADIAAVVANLNDAMAAAGATVTSVIDAAGQTLTGALTAAAGLNDTVWDGLIGTAGANPTLVSVLVALKAASSGGLSELIESVGAVGERISLTAGQVSEILTSAVTGTLGTALQAVANIVNDPLAVSSYIGLLGSPFGIAGLAIQSGITGLDTLASNGLRLGSTLVHGVSAQISNALAVVNNLLGAGKTLTDIALIDGALTAIQGIVSAPVTAVLAGVNGVTDAATSAGVATLSRIAGGANAIVGTWLGSGATPGAVQAVLTRIGSAPLSPASYTNAVSILVGAAATTVDSVVDTANSFASLPFRVAADLTGTGAAVVNALVNGLATAASGILQAAGVSSIVAGLPHNLATVITTAVNVAALATKATLNTIAAAIDVGQAIGGLGTFQASAADPIGMTLKVSRPTAAQIDPDEAPLAQEVADLDVDAQPATTASVDPAATTEDSEPAADKAPEQAATLETPAAPVTDTDTEPTTAPALAAEESTPDSTNEIPASTTDFDTVEKPDTDGEPATDSEPSESEQSASVRADQPRHALTEFRLSANLQTDTTSRAIDTYGRHAAAVDRDTSSTSSSDSTTSQEGGRHRRGDDSASDAQRAGGSKSGNSDKLSAAAA